MISAILIFYLERGLNEIEVVSRIWKNLKMIFEFVWNLFLKWTPSQVKEETDFQPFSIFIIFQISFHQK
jgi:hypothetical protein